MRIKTITCHDVYNVGASLQAYALQKYLEDQGNDVEIIDYKPDYLSHHYDLSYIPNPKFRKPFLSQMYLIAKFPGRWKAMHSMKKQYFDEFTKQYLKVTTTRYSDNEVLKNNLPEADVYVAGSDQIWNPVFQNGHDPAFFLQFVPDKKKKISYAASFAVDSLNAADQKRMKSWLKTFDAISVREQSGVKLLEEMNLEGKQLCDPVFLLDKEEWKEVSHTSNLDQYILVYDFDNNPNLKDIAKYLSEKYHSKIVSMVKSDYADIVNEDVGPREFLGLIQNAKIVISNSFHATAFSLLFHKDFYVMNRNENINTRMRDLLLEVGLPDRLVSTKAEVLEKEIHWNEVDLRIDEWKVKANQFLNDSLNTKEE